jgi:competence ComEA-like helix-hairpin-helix protein
MKVKQIVKDYLTFNRMEQRGLSVLMGLLTIVIMLNFFSGHRKLNVPADITAFDFEVRAFEKAVAGLDSADSVRRRNSWYSARPGTSRNGADSMGRPVFPRKELIMIELNRADTMDLQQLRGIGSSFARRIVRYREKLGGYICPEQLLEIPGMDTTRFNSIRGQLRIFPDSVRLIDLNTVTFKQLLSHPYFPFPVTKAVILYRNAHKTIRSVDELRTVPGVSDSLFRKMKPYVKTG